MYLQQGSQCLRGLPSCPSHPPPPRPSSPQVLVLVSCNIPCSVTSWVTKCLVWGRALKPLPAFPVLGVQRGMGGKQEDEARSLGTCNSEAHRLAGDGERPFHTALATPLVPSCERVSLPQARSLPQPQPLTGWETGACSRAEQRAASGPGTYKGEQHLLGASQELCEAPSLTLSPQPHPHSSPHRLLFPCTPFLFSAPLLSPYPPFSFPVLWPPYTPCPPATAAPLSSSLLQPSVGRVLWHRSGRAGKGPVKDPLSQEEQLCML